MIDVSSRYQFMIALQTKSDPYLKIKFGKDSAGVYVITPKQNTISMLN